MNHFLWYFCKVLQKEKATNKSLAVLNETWKKSSQASKNEFAVLKGRKLLHYKQLITVGKHLFKVNNNEWISYFSELHTLF